MHRVRKINTEIKRNYLLFGLCLALFVAFNVFVTGNFISRYTKLLEEYRLVNDMAVSYNDSKTYFHLYMKQHEMENKNQFEKSNEKAISILDNLYEPMQRDRDCTMMYRVVHQMLEHRQEQIIAYMDPAIPVDQGGITYIENLDLLIDGNMNLLNSYYLEYISGVFSAYSGNLQKLTTTVNIALLIMAFFSFFINTSIYRDMLKSVEKLTEAAQEIKEQNFGVEDIADTPYLEMNFVIRTFNEMKHTIHDMILEINKNFEIKQRLAEQVLENERQERRLAESKMKELQMQINPHFLFNTLSLVMRSIQLGDKDISILLIKSISKILRSSIEIRSTSIPIDDEIELLESYLYIQRVHCKGRIDFQLDVRKSYMDDDIEVPPLIIQPLIENAIQHGLKNTVDDGKVSISIIEKAEYIEVVVKDNGTGMNPEVLDNLENHVQTKSIGLYNVIERLRLRYHRDDVVDIDSGEHGTKITLYLYKETGAAHD